MKPRSPRPLSSLAALWALGTALLGPGAAAQAASAEADRPPANARKPEAVHDLKSAVRQTAAVVEGRVSDIQHEYSDAEGPWTRVTLSDVKAHLGSAPATLELRHFGGPLPNGRLMVAAELPAFVKGKRYVVFLRNTAWNLSPVVGELALRAENVGGREVLVNTDGFAVTGVGPRGVETGPALFERLPFDGSAPKPLGARAESTASAALDAHAFVQALAGAAESSRLRVGGRFYARPAGEFKWRGNATSATAGAQAPAAGAAAEAAPEIDTSRPN